MRLKKNEAAGHIDQKTGLKYVKKIEIYQKMLNRFLIQQSDLSKQIESSLQRKDMDSVRRQAHSLKGSAGMLGMHKLHEIAGAYENLVRNGAGEEELNASLGALSREITAVCEEIERMNTPPRR